MILDAMCESVFEFKSIYLRKVRIQDTIRFIGRVNGCDLIITSNNKLMRCCKDEDVLHSFLDLRSRSSLLVRWLERRPR